MEDPTSDMAFSCCLLSSGQRSNACRIHAAAAEYCELLETDPSGWPGDVDTPREPRRINPSLGLRDILLYDPRVISLADIDVVGLQPVTSLLI